MFIAVFVRLIALGSRTLWYDEAFAVLFSEKGLNAMLYGTLTSAGGAAADVHPLLYYTTLGALMSLFGQSPVAVRLYSVLLGVATILMLYLLARDLFGERAALVTALIGALSPFHVQYSQEARMYALLGLVLVSATWAFVRAWRTHRTAYWIAFGILSGLAMYSQQLAAFYLLAIGLIPVLASRKDQMRPLALSAALALLIYLPWLVNLPAQFGKLGTYWIPRPSFVQPLLTLWAFVFVELPVSAAPAVIISTITLVLVIIMLMYRVFSLLHRHGKDSHAVLFVLWLVIAPIAFMWLLSQWRPVYLTRALLPSGLMLYVALGWLLTRARLPKPIIGILAVLGLLTVGSGLYFHYTWDTFPRPPFDSADQLMAGKLEAGDRIVHANKLTMLPMVYYNRTLLQHYIGDIPGSAEDTLARPTQETLGLFADECLSSAAQAAPRVWFVIFREQIEQEGGQSHDLRWLDTHYHQQSVATFNDLLVYLYDQPASDVPITCKDDPNAAG